MGGWVTLLESGSRAILWDVIECRVNVLYLVPNTSRCE